MRAKYARYAWFSLVMLSCTKAVTPPIPTPVCNGQAAGAQASAHWVAHPGPQHPAARAAALQAKVQIGVYLSLRDEDGLDAFLAHVHDPSHPLHGHFLTPVQFMQRFGPTAQTVNAAIAALERHGMVVSPKLHGSVLHAEGTVQAVQNSFNVGIAEHVSVDGETALLFTGPVTHLAGIPISLVQGMSPPPKRHTHIARALPVTPYGFGAKAIRKAYNVPDNATGIGQRIGIVSLDGYDPADIAAYAKSQGIRQVPLTNILVAGYDGGISDPSAQIEVSLDIELANAMAPGAAEIRVYMGANRDFLRVLNEVANPSLGDRALVKFISCSWGAPESQMSPAAARAEEAIFRQMAAQGQTFFAASGDNGAIDDGRSIGTDDPASHPNVVAVGGTQLHVQADGTWLRENTWSGSGGGESCYWPAPPWQRAVPSATPGRTDLMPRLVPDVALNADPTTGYLVLSQGRWTVVGGTSCAAPLWAGIATLLAEGRGMARKPLGVLAPLLYSIAQQPGSAQAFHDIADGGSNGYYVSAPGYDDATGWGSADVSMLLNTVVRSP